MHYFISFILALSVFFDLRTGAIPNSITFGSLVVVLSYQLMNVGWSAFFTSIGLATLAFVLFVIPFMLNYLGGGDIKLIMVLAALQNSAADIFGLLINLSIWGGAVALACMIFKPHLKRSSLKGFTMMSNNKLPYSLAIALGYFFPVFW